MKLLQLQYFCTACKYNNITRASEELHISQPSISNAIKELEAEFGVTLFRRLKKGFTLTEEGETLLKHAQELLQHAERISLIMSDKSEERRSIRIGIPPMTGISRLPKLYRGFKSICPEVSLSTHEFGANSLLASLRDETLDLAIIPTNVVDHARFSSLDLGEVETVFCVPSDHRLAGEKSVDIRALRGEPLILFDKGFIQYDVITSAFASAGIEPNIVHLSSQLYMIKEFISSGFACGFMFRDIAETIPDIVSIPLKDPIKSKIILIWSKERHMSTDVMKFIDYAKGAKL
ncbi:MAG: LysR family transcriptional regulator [Oscillospiraceae bacterium]|nr:LysR family transcriptional regulator [Oscillospiraceae bacterium]MBQ4545351.1 LysR family transcriptional regulator [Oscillospiraceae bacterium]MBQ6901632.1 LysR family transcriptional regulator [Oscillospiraceae bacterium]